LMPYEWRHPRRDPFIDLSGYSTGPDGEQYYKLAAHDGAIVIRS
jgi:hypothetical protein